MNLEALYGLVDPDMAKLMRNDYQAYAKAIVMKQGSKEFGEHGEPPVSEGCSLYLVLMCVELPVDLGELASYTARIELDPKSREDREDLRGLGASGIIRSPVFATLTPKGQMLRYTMRPRSGGTLVFTAPSRGGYVHLDARQICHGGGWKGSARMCSGSLDSLKRVARSWWRQHCAGRARGTC